MLTKKKKKKKDVRSGIRTYASIWRPERPLPLLNGKVYCHLESGALDRSAILTPLRTPSFSFFFDKLTQLFTYLFSLGDIIIIFYTTSSARPWNDRV